MSTISPFAALARKSASEAKGSPAVPPAAAATGLPEVVGLVESMRVFGDWGIANIRTEDRQGLKVTGAAVKELKEGLEYRFAGRIKRHPKHGESFEIESASPHIAPNLSAIAKFLAANFDGVGVRSANKMVDAVLKEGGQDAVEKLRKQLLEEPWSVDFSIIGRKGEYSSEQKDETVAAYVQRDLATRIGAIEGLRGGVLKALSLYLAQRALESVPAAAAAGGGATKKNPVELAWALLARNPYEPITIVAGYGFAMADQIGKQVNIPRDAPERLAALVAHALRENCEGHGHTFLTLEQLEGSVAKLDPRVRVDDAIAVAIKAGTIELDDNGGHPGPDGEPVERYYRPALLDAECALASRIADMLHPVRPLWGGPKRKDSEAMSADLADKIQAAARAASPSFKNGMDPSQVEALARVISSPVRLHTVTAGPGCGKTALMEVLVKLLPGKDFVFCGPTGKSAKVLTNRVRNHGYSATTIHSLLRGSGRGSFQYDESNPLNGDVLVVDEGTMPDLTLFEAVLAAANSDMHVIVLGDPRQLPSIQPGRVLSDLLHVSAVDHNHLTKTHRNSGGILEVVNEVGEGNLRCEDRESVTFSHGLPPPELGFRDVMAAYTDAVARRGIENVMLMMSRRQGDVSTPGYNTTYANSLLREVCNPNAPKVPGTALHVGDRIIIRDNMTIEQPADPKRPDAPVLSVDVVNGDTGTIKGFDLDDKDARNGAARWLRLVLDDGRAIKFPGSATNALAHAYALTVHAGQGSEYPEVIVVATPGHPTFVNRNMLFTGLSRAREQLRVFGEDKVLMRIAATPLPPRNSALVERVLAELAGENEEASDRKPERERRAA